MLYIPSEFSSFKVATRLWKLLKKVITMDYYPTTVAARSKYLQLAFACSFSPGVWFVGEGMHLYTYMLDGRVLSNLCTRLPRISS